MQKMEPSYGVGLGNKPPTMGNLMQPIGVLLLFWWVWVVRKIF